MPITISGHRPSLNLTPPRVENNDVVAAEKTVFLGFFKRKEISRENLNNYFCRLENWANSAPTEFESNTRTYAVEQIKELVKKHGYDIPKLNLNDLGLTSLPPLPDGTKKLDISNNELTRIGNLPSALRKLNMQANKVTVPPENLHTLSRKCTVKLDERLALTSQRLLATYHIYAGNHCLGPQLKSIPDGSLPDYHSLPSNSVPPPRYEPAPPPYQPATLNAPPTDVSYVPPPPYELNNPKQHTPANDVDRKFPVLPRAIPATFSPERMGTASTSHQANSHGNGLWQDLATTSTTPLTPRDASVMHQRLSSDASLSNDYALRQNSATSSTTPPLTPRDAWITHRRLASDASLSNDHALQQNSATSSTALLTPRDAWITHRRLASDASLSSLSTGSNEVFYESEDDNKVVKHKAVPQQHKLAPSQLKPEERGTRV